MILQGKPTIGVATAFTGKYQGSKVITRFVELLNVKLIKTSVTRPAMIEAGSALASAEFCLPLRVYIGHVYNLITEHPELDYILAPIIKGEHPDSSTCAKYRDLDGVIIRSLSSMTGYRLKQNNLNGKKELSKLIGVDRTEGLLAKANSFPRIIAPEIESLAKDHLRQTCGKVYAEIFQMSKTKLFRFLASSRGLNNARDEEFRIIEAAFEQSYREIIEEVPNKYQRLLGSKEKIRLALVGRSYLVEDPALSADIKNYFIKQGVAVITPDDIPFNRLKDRYEQVDGFYDSHRLNQSFIDTVIDEVDGFIAIGSFGCHPDAFQIDYFAKYIAEKGKACWTFKFDEQAGGVGFHTRYETILGFLQQKRDERLSRTNEGQPQLQGDSQNKNKINWDYPITRANKQSKPVFIWPHMGAGIDLLLKETWMQLGLQSYLYPPRSVNEETILKGNIRYTETCSPFALYFGSLKDTLDRLFSELRSQAKKTNKPVEPRRIIILMAGGKGPCTFGWYAIAGQKALLEDYQELLQKDGHSLEMIAIDNQGRNLISFLQELGKSAENDRLKTLIEMLKQIEGKSLNPLQKTRKELEIIKLLKMIIWPGWQKLLAFEEIQNKALVVRAHELVRGSTTKLLKESITRLEEAHSLKKIEDTKELLLQEFDMIEQDKEVKPKVVIVGEIYVSLTSFANRGTVDNLLGQLGIEAVEGMRLSHFIKGAFKGLKVSFLQNLPLLKPIINKLEAKGFYNPNQWVREPEAMPFLEHEIGGDGQPTVARARHHIEQDGVDGILHIYPFKCMPEGIAKDALIEMCQLYSIKSLHLSFDKELEIERLKTELGTFAALLKQDLEKKVLPDWQTKELVRRKAVGKSIEDMYKRGKQLQRV